VSKPSQPGHPQGLVGRILGRVMAWHNDPDNRWTISLLNLQSRDRVLEVGSGPGRAIARAAVKTREGFVAGVDHAALMARMARKRNARAAHEGRVQLSQADVAALPYGDAFFDKVFSINCIYFWPDPLAGLKELKRVLKPTGTLAITVRDRQREAYKPFTSDNLQALLEATGFRNVRVETGPFPRHPLLCVLGGR
jgi:ubiquinone/menaquinone biosynthesis C-methylase UbiE